jgi:hypothetical protein
MKKF